MNFIFNLTLLNEVFISLKLVLNDQKHFQCYVENINNSFNNFKSSTNMITHNQSKKLTKVGRMKMRDQEMDKATCFAGRNHCCNIMNIIKLERKEDRQ